MESKVLQAKNFAAAFHKDHIRISGESLYDHLLRVFNKLEDSGVTNEDILAASLLHHINEYSPKKEFLLNEFGHRVLEIVTVYNKLSSYHVELNTPRKFNEKFIIQTFLNLARDLDVLAIRFADRADNVETSYVFPKEKRKDIALRAMNIYSPICRFLGLNNFVKSMENESFKILQPSDYHKIKRYVEQLRPDVEDFFEDAENVLISLLGEKQISAQVYSRFKHYYSIYRKFKKLYTRGEVKNINAMSAYDLAALRVIVDRVEHCYEVEDVLSTLWDPVSTTRDDYIQSPKPNGYKSLQCSYKVAHAFNAEFQIRTKDMHEHNEFGLASHAFYKIGTSFKENLEKDPTWLKKLNYWETEAINKELEHKPVANKIYIFSPKGDIFELPCGALVLDFAYALHADIGHGCVGATVNGKIAKITDRLTDGDTVEIKVSKSKRMPSKDWLEVVQTKKAKALIRKRLKK
ncbi:MAG: TGS domain-containing protein [Patescibacteria group bacterium]